MTLELTDAERELLLEILRDRLGTLREQVHHATVSKFHSRLKDQESLIEGLIARLEGAGTG